MAFFEKKKLTFERIAPLFLNAHKFPFRYSSAVRHFDSSTSESPGADRLLDCFFCFFCALWVVYFCTPLRRKHADALKTIDTKWGFTCALINSLGGDLMQINVTSMKIS